VAARSVEKRLHLGGGRPIPRGGTEDDGVGLGQGVGVGHGDVGEHLLGLDRSQPALPEQPRIER